MKRRLSDLRQEIEAEEGQPLLRTKERVEEQQRTFWVRMCFFSVFWLLLGVWCGCVIENWSFVTSLYVVVQIVTTIGYGDVTVHTDLMKLFMAIYVLICIVFLANVITNAMEGAITRRSEQMRYQLDKAEARMRNRSRKNLGQSETAEQIEALWGPRNKVLAALFYFVMAVVIGTVFYAVMEPCSCSYGLTHVEECEEGARCAGTGGAVKTWTSSFYMAVITLTTVGFGDHSPKSWIGRIFGCAWMLIGVVITGQFVSACSNYINHVNRKARTVERISENLFRILDTDRNGSLSRREFQAYALLKYDMVSEEDLACIDQLFDRMDKDKNGSVTYEEITSCCDAGAFPVEGSRSRTRT